MSDDPRTSPKLPVEHAGHDIHFEDVEDYTTGTYSDGDGSSPDVSVDMDHDGNVAIGDVGGYDSSSRKTKKNYRFGLLITKMKQNPMMVGFGLIASLIVLIAILVLVGGGPADKEEEETFFESASSSGGHPDLPKFTPNYREHHEPLMEKLSALYDRHEVLASSKNALDPESSQGTPQNKAFYWLATDLDLEGVDNINHTEMVQRYALAVLYFATNSVTNPFTEIPKGHKSPPVWESAYNWLSKEHECQWNGIICDNDQKIIQILLERNQMSGTLPQELAFLGSTLQKLDLSSNHIYMNDLTSDYDDYKVFEHLPKLESLLLSENYLVSQNGIPYHLQGLTSLQELHLSDNMLKGHLNRPNSRHALQQMALQLTSLHFEYNELSGIIPDIIGTDMIQLKNFFCRGNKIQSNLAFLETGLLTNLERLWIGHNDITGTIPSEIGLATSLKSVSITHGSMTGTIPSTIGQLTNMERLWLYENDLEGEIPVSMNNLSNLEVLEVHHNKLTGHVPHGICNTVQSSEYDFKSLTSDCDTSEGDGDTTAKVACGSDCCTQCF